MEDRERRESKRLAHRVSQEDNVSEDGVSSSSSMTASLSKKPSKFIMATYRMLTAPENHNAISFSSDGRAIEIKDTKVLKSTILSKYFNHNNVASFTRQLNNYGFETQISRTGVHQTFVHPLFENGRIDQLPKVERRQTASSKGDLSAQLKEKEILEDALKKRVSELERDKIELTYQNSALVEENRRLRAFIHTQFPSIPHAGPSSVGTSHQPIGPPQPPPPPRVNRAQPSPDVYGPARHVGEQDYFQQHHLRGAGDGFADIVTLTMNPNPSPMASNYSGAYAMGPAPSHHPAGPGDAGLSLFGNASPLPTTAASAHEVVGNPWVEEEDQ